MKLQVSFDLTDLQRALTIAQTIHNDADILEIGSLLIYKYGDEAVKAFRAAFPSKTLLVDAKIIDRSQEAITLFAEAGADWITVMAGAGAQTIHTACTVAHGLGKKVMLDLADAPSLGQSALEAKSLGADALTFHKPSFDDQQILLQERWDMVQGNSELPIFISAHTTRDTITEIMSLNPTGIIIGSAIVGAADPSAEIKFFSDVLGR
jgi:3-hexulose-6-phosphate synthase